MLCAAVCSRRQVEKGLGCCKFWRLAQESAPGNAPIPPRSLIRLARGIDSNDAAAPLPLLRDMCAPASPAMLHKAARTKTPLSISPTQHP